MSRTPLLAEEGNVRGEKLCPKNQKLQPCYPSRHSRNQKGELTAETQRIVCFGQPASSCSRGLRFLQSKHDALDTFSQKWSVKINEQSELPSTKFQITEQLSLMDGE